MKKEGQASSVEYVHLVREFEELVGGRINKVYQDGSFFLFPVYTGSRRTNLVLDIPRVAYFTDNKPSFSRPGGFCMFLRKRIQNCRVVGVEQVGFDRILKFSLETKDAQYLLFVELFGKGNLVLCDTDKKIISAFDNVAYKDRSVRGGVVYELPELQPDVRALSEESFAEFFGSEACVKVLASSVGLGGEYAELVCARAGVDKNLVEVDASLLRAEVLRLLEESEPQHTDSLAYPVRVLEDATSVESFSAAVAAIRDGELVSARQEERVEVVEEFQNKYERIVSSQEKQMRGFSKSIEQNQRKGELLYEHYSVLSQLLYEASVDRKELSNEAFVEKYEAHPLVAEASPMEFTLEFSEEGS